MPRPSDPKLLMSTLLSRLAAHVAERPRSQAYRLGSAGALTYGELGGAVASLASLLQRHLPPGAVVVLSCGNRLEYPIAFLGILAAGCAAFPISPDAADAEILRAAGQANALGVIGDERAIGLLGASTRIAIPIAGVRSNTGGVLQPSPSGDLLLQSSGTTATPKIVRRTGKSLDSVASAMVDAIGFTTGDRVLMTVPLTHSYGLEHGLLAPVWAGSCVHLCGLLPLSELCSEMRDAEITVLPGVPSTFEMLAASSERCMTARTVRVAYSAGAPLPRAVFDHFAARFSVCVSQLYGATEIGSVTFNSARYPFDPASVGKPMRDVSIRVVSLDGKVSPLSSGEEGQVTIRAASMFSGYFDASTDLLDGHFPTGDLGYVDDAGRLFITGRLKLLIDVGGLKVNPLEVESVLMRHPLVQDCVVIPVRQSETLFRLKAVVTCRDPSAKPDINELRQLAREQLSPYKIPRMFEVRETLPRSSTGKILRHLVERGEIH
jgi:acyl-CoA synthetase (AMP-forming)/AMP-acid ligase II